MTTRKFDKSIFYFHIPEALPWEGKASAVIHRQGLCYNKKVKKESLKSNKTTKGFTPIVDFDEVSIRSKRSKEPTSKFTTGFTLIELLVVIAIIGILSAVVIASLNSAREKGKIATIKSTLKQLYNQAALNQVESGSFIGSNDGNLNCTGPNNNLAKIAQSLIDQGIVVKCYSRNDSSRNDVYLRFGATAIIYETNNFKAYSVDENGVVTWDQLGVNNLGQPVDTDTNTGMLYSISNTACAIYGGKLPSLEQVFTLSSAYGAASFTLTGTTTYKPTSPGFISGWYWSSTLVPSDTSQAYFVNFNNGAIGVSSTLSSDYVRCVR